MSVARGNDKRDWDIAECVETGTRKRPRYLMAYEESFRNILGDEDFSPGSAPSPSFDLRDLFGCSCNSCHRSGRPLTQEKPGGRRWQRSGFSNPKHEAESAFFTLRMEHRKGGILTQHRGEGRLLIFRSDRAGSIAKIVYSSAQNGVEGDAVAGTMSTVRVAATIHVLSVKEEYRGHGLGNLLFSEAMKRLKQQHSEAEFIRVSFYAEEDIRRHNRLVQFYLDMGCTIKKNGRIQFVNNNDGEVYRRIPMEISLDQRSSLPSSSLSLSSVLACSSFLPIFFCGRTPSLGKSSSWRKAVGWLVAQVGNGLELLPTRDRETPTVHRIRLLRASDKKEGIFHEHRGTCCLIDEGLWLIQSTETGLFLEDETENHNLVFSKELSFWQPVMSSLCLVKSSDTPTKRSHYRRMWSTQSVEYAKSMQSLYLRFDCRRLTLKDALNYSKLLPANPFFIPTNRISGSAVPSLRTLMYSTAELARSEGHPDWIQLVALMYGLAGILTFFLDPESLRGYDWTIHDVEARVLGCKRSNCAAYPEFHNLSPDKEDPRYSTRLGMYEKEHEGLENVLLSWTSNDYMYFMLKYNSISIPDEAFTVLKLSRLVDWHCRGEYTSLSNEEDEQMKQFVADFYDLCIRAQQSLSQSKKELSDNECNSLWDSYYSHIVQKYGARKQLCW
mmetsp:Transcript_24212/g.42556  ORF Transcript_24212/g.42556 Transcript_24212/m.42556 type:complete len:669 (-) Transcript_24212:52-2058(-)